MASKLTIYGGTATALVLIGYWLGKRRAAPKPEIGDTGISGIDYAIAMPKMGLKAASQIRKAQLGKWLSSYKSAGNLSTFSSTPAYNVGAYYTGAWWMAVAGRILHSRSLGSHADALAMKGAAVYALPGSSLLKGSVGEILTSAAATISQAGASATGSAKSQITFIVAKLQAMASPGSVRVAQSSAADKAWVERGTAQTATDLTTVAGNAVNAFSTVSSPIRALVGLPAPNGQQYPAWQRWALRGVAGVAAVLLARWYLKGTVRRTMSAARAGLAAARGVASGQPRPNPAPKSHSVQVEAA